jgi:hypothetical protein
VKLLDDVRHNVHLTAPQRRVVVVLLLIAITVCVVRYALRPSYVPDPQPTEGRAFDRLATRIDPNTADWPALAVLPAIGEKRAKDIVAYREMVERRSPGEKAFRGPDDLLRVPGIGKVLAGRLGEHLIFPESFPPTTPR